MNDIGQRLLRDVQTYTSDVQDEIKKAVDKRAGEMVREIKSASPVRQGTEYKRRGKYAPGSYKKGWRKRVLRDNNGKYLVAAVQSQNQKPLVHLLDRGHNIITRNRARNRRGRVEGTNIVQDAQEKYTRLIQQDIQRILHR